MKKPFHVLAIAAAAVTAEFAGAAPALAAEQPAGKPVVRHGMKIAGVFLQPVHMSPAGPRSPEKTDIHLEADIQAVAGNRNGFAAGAWVPYLRIRYRLAKQGSRWTATGMLMPMVASDGPHYGANVKLAGPGVYTVRFDIAPPEGARFGRHVDKETGVAAWWPPFVYTGRFVFAGTGKKGDY